MCFVGWVSHLDFTKVEHHNESTTENGKNNRALQGINVTFQLIWFFLVGSFAFIVRNQDSGITICNMMFNVCFRKLGRCKMQRGDTQSTYKYNVCFQLILLLYWQAFGVFAFYKLCCPLMKFSSSFIAWMFLCLWTFVLEVQYLNVLVLLISLEGILSFATKNSMTRCLKWLHNWL